MLTVTPAARARLLTKLLRRKADQDIALRVTRKKKGWRLRPDRARPDDTAIEHEGRNVLLLDAEVAERMAALTLDVHATHSGARLKLRRNA